MQSSHGKRSSVFIDCCDDKLEIETNLEKNMPLDISQVHENNLRHKSDPKLNELFEKIFHTSVAFGSCHTTGKIKA